ncbi:hypothetical protein [Mesorhizobium carmichaelinearum]|nr:hypothetical protein [Mesorhizobium carmichaelinearum]
MKAIAEAIALLSLDLLAAQPAPTGWAFADCVRRVKEQQDGTASPP